MVLSGIPNLLPSVPATEKSAGKDKEGTMKKLAGKKTGDVNYQDGLILLGLMLNSLVKTLLKCDMFLNPVW